MPFQPTTSPLEIRFSVGTLPELGKTAIEVDSAYYTGFGRDYERYIIPEAVVERVKSWPDYQRGDEEARAKLMLMGLLQYVAATQEQ